MRGADIGAGESVLAPALLRGEDGPADLLAEGEADVEAELLDGAAVVLNLAALGRLEGAVEILRRADQEADARRTGRNSIRHAKLQNAAQQDGAQLRTYAVPDVRHPVHRDEPCSELGSRAGRLRAGPACGRACGRDARLRPSDGPSSRTASRSSSAASSRGKRLRAAAFSSARAALDRHCYREQLLAKAEPPFVIVISG